MNEETKKALELARRVLGEVETPTVGGWPFADKQARRSAIDAIDAALAAPAAPVAQGSSWLIAADLAENNAAIREALEAFAADKTGDNAAGIVAAVLDTAPAPASPVARVPGPPIAVFDEFGRGADDRVQDYAARLVDEARAAPAAPVAPAGWVLMPSELTADMEHAANNARCNYKAEYRAMVAARPMPPATAAPVALTDEQIERGRKAIFSTENPFCPCDSKTMRKAVRWAERAHGITKGEA